MNISDTLKEGLSIESMPLYKEDIERFQQRTLAPYAMVKPVVGSRIYREEEKGKQNRSDFQRDRDRIIHSKAFRRLMYKTQVFVNHEGDHFRTRLTHSLEVSQISRGICRSLALNEDLAEAISLGHDLGHTPFGHAVESVLNEKMKLHGGFLHNEQSLRTVDILERRSREYTGLNLTREVREGILKHNSDTSKVIYLSLNPEKPCSNLEGQVVNIVDTMTYTCHDLDDAIKSGLFMYGLRNNTKMADDFKDLHDDLLASLGVNLSLEKIDDTICIRELIHQLVLHITDNSWKNISEYDISTTEKVTQYANRGIRIVGLGDKESAFKHLKSFVKNYVYKSQTITIMDQKAKQVVNNIWDAFIEKPNQMPIEQYEDYQKADTLYIDYDGYKCNKERIICDYIATMTDRYALEIYRQLFDPHVKIEIRI